jgi:DNA-binding MarR family transcriptional regulator
MICQMSFMIPRGQEVYSRARSREISAAGYRHLAEFRYRIRQFLHLSEEAARSNGIEPQQHQLLLAIKGLPDGSRPTVRTLAERLCLRHHSTVELIDRLVEQRAVSRRHSEQDRREVLIELTPHGEELLHQLSVLLWQELRVSGPALSESLLTVLAHPPGRGRGRIESA